MGNIWSCKIGEVEHKLPSGSGGPLRQAVAEAYRKLTGQEPDFNFSGWGAALTESERAAVGGPMPKRKEVMRVAKGPKPKPPVKKPAPKKQPWV